MRNAARHRKIFFMALSSLRVSFRAKVKRHAYDGVAFRMKHEADGRKGGAVTRRLVRQDANPARGGVPPRERPRQLAAKR